MIFYVFFYIFGRFSLLFHFLRHILSNLLLQQKKTYDAKNLPKVVKHIKTNLQKVTAVSGFRRKFVLKKKRWGVIFAPPHTE